MQRTPEPELMNDLEQVVAYGAADFSRSDTALIEALEQLCLANKQTLHAGDRLLDLGCGPGNISERLARQWPHCDVIGLDAAARMLALAEQRRQQDQPRLHRLRYQASSMQDLCTAPSLEATVLVSNSLLHHLHDPQDLWRLHRRHGRGSALVLHRDLRRPDSPEQALALRERHLPDAPQVLKDDYLASLHAAFTAAEVEEQLAAAGLQTLEVVERDDRYLEVRGRLS
jgi:trans-aconitate 2-methyltransferase